MLFRGKIFRVSAQRERCASPSYLGITHTLYRVIFLTLIGIIMHAAEHLTWILQFRYIKYNIFEVAHSDFRTSGFVPEFMKGLRVNGL